MRILKIDEAKKADIDFIYGKNQAIAIVEEDFETRFKVSKREDV